MLTSYEDPLRSSLGTSYVLLVIVDPEEVR